MRFDAQPPRLSSSGSVGSRAKGVAVKLLAGAAAGLMLVSAVAISIALFAVALTGLFVLGAYLWWKTRDLRKRMHSQTHSRFEEGDVIDGVVIRKVEVTQVEKR